MPVCNKRLKLSSYFNQSQSKRIIMNIKHFLIACTGLLYFNGAAQNRVLPENERTATIKQVTTLLNQQYIFPDIAKKMGDYISKKEKAGKYKHLSGDALAAELTKDLRSISHDKHLRIAYFADSLPDVPEEVTMQPSEEQKAGLAVYLRNINYGISDIKVMNGNIGYINFSVFCVPEFAGDTYAAAMNYLAHTDALIIDLRNCGGSTSPNAIPFICSYLFNEPTHLNDIYWRKDNKTIQSWTYAYVTGKKYLNKPVYVLTSSGSFSGAEEFAYDLQNLKRATIIGETTGGGANPGGDIRVNDHFTMFTPVGRAISPVTGTNWEGVGVKPDVQVNQTLALHRAQELAYAELLKNPSDPQWGAELQRLYTLHKDNAPKMRTIIFKLKGYDDAKQVNVAGSFNNWNSERAIMQRQNGAWVYTTEAPEGKVSYKFIVDGRWMPDPANPETEGTGDLTNSIKY